MPITPQQLTLAAAGQDIAAHDSNSQIRLIAGPGTGKSFTIEARICWLLQNGVEPGSIFAISFTNASARDLRSRISKACIQKGLSGDQISVTTMHSLAMRMLTKAGILLYYPVPPIVLDDWETQIFDDEFCRDQSIVGGRAREIRMDHEAYWSTGTFNPANFIPPDPPITDPERTAFDSFSQSFGQTYASVLPGEIIRQCLIEIKAGSFDPVGILSIQHLIVDEYQDLNPIDLEFVDRIIQGGAAVFVAGDDDQSLYSFRFALPEGIQTFATKYPTCSKHNLDHCFRCATDILASAMGVITAFPPVNRIAKTLASLYAGSAPPVAGTVHRWRFDHANTEASAIAQSCLALVNAQLDPAEILILISNRRVLDRQIKDALALAGVPFEADKNDFKDTDEGRILFDLTRIICRPDDYIAHRSLLGLLPGVGVGTCLKIHENVVASSLNFRNIFYNALPSNVFSTKEEKAIKRLAHLLALIADLTKDNSITDSEASLLAAADLFSTTVRTTIENVFNSLPKSLTIEELRELLTTSSEERQEEIIAEGYKKLNQEPAAKPEVTKKVRIMTMHGAKGLSARVVFIPGLEEQIFPGPRRQPYPGLILEAARLLYVSITRARASCILSFSKRRRVNGQLTFHTPSRYNSATGGAFVQRGNGLDHAETTRIISDCAAL